jgi:hypothetical protein
MLKLLLALSSSFFLDKKRSKKIKAVEKKAKNLEPILKRNELAPTFEAG